MSYNKLSILGEKNQKGTEKRMTTKQKQRRVYYFLKSLFIFVGEIN